MDKRIALFNQFSKYNFSQFDTIKILGKGYQGTVYLCSVKKIHFVTKKIKTTSDYTKQPLQSFPFHEGLSEIVSSKLVNFLLLNKIVPSLIFSYHFKIQPSSISIFYEYSNTLSLKNFLKSNKKNSQLSFNILFQILTTLYAFKKFFNIVHSDLHFNNILVTLSPIKSNSFYSYTIDNTTYYLPNLGVQIRIIDYGLFFIPGKMSQLWQERYYSKLIKSNKYNFIDFYSLTLEMPLFFKTHFKFFFDVFHKKLYDEFFLTPIIKSFPPSLSILSLIKFIFHNKKYLSDCKTYPYYCLSNKPHNPYIIDSFNMDSNFHIQNSFLSSFKIND